MRGITVVFRYLVKREEIVIDMTVSEGFMQQDVPGRIVTAHKALGEALWH